MPVAVYILYSPSLERYYVGHAEDPVLRLEQDHNGGRNTSTKAGRPWEHRWVKWFNTRAEAMAMERAIKARTEQGLPCSGAPSLGSSGGGSVAFLFPSRSPALP